MARKPDHVTPDPVVLNGYQSVFKLTANYNNYCLAIDITDPAFIEELEARRAELLAAQLAEIKTKKRAVAKPAPWIEDEEQENLWNIKFSWGRGFEPSVVDSVGTVLTASDVKLYSGATVKVAFDQRGYTLKDGITYGTTLDIRGIQVISDSVGAGGAQYTQDEVKGIFGEFDGGFQVGDIPPAAGDDEETEGNGDF